MNIKKITIKRFRSIDRMTINIGGKGPVIVCGANNVGKTNFLRALDLFFSLSKNKFDKDIDIPYDIAKARTTGGRYNTTIEVIFDDENGRKCKVKTVFGWKKDKGNYLRIKASRGANALSETEARKLIRGFRFLFIEASNVDLPKLIAEIIDEEVLPLGLDPLRKKQTSPLKKLKKFISASKDSVKGIENAIEENVNRFITDVPGIDTRGWKVEILFAEFEKLREALSGLIDFTLYDRSKRKMESKGSGIQRIVLLSIMKYISDRSKRRIIWGVDEPEAFLQPALQKKTFDILKVLAKSQQVIFTTHSQHFIDIVNVKNTYLLEASYHEREYAKKKDEVFYRVNTYVDEECSEYQKIQKIRKHLGMMRNDGWELMPYNLLVEGEEDKKYIETFAEIFAVEAPNIFVADGASKMKGYLQYLTNLAEDINFKPKIRCLLDNDKEGRDTHQSLTKAADRFRKLEMIVESIPRVDGLKGASHENEIEDFIYPEVLYRAVSKFLKKRDYKSISAKGAKERFQTAYDRKTVLSFLSEKVKALNPSKLEINFEDSNDGVKKIICQRVCEILLSKDATKWRNQYPEVEIYIKKICPTT